MGRANMKPKTQRAIELLDCFQAVYPDVIQTMMRESGMSGKGSARIAVGIRLQINSYLSSVSHGAAAPAPGEAETVRELMTALIAAARQRQFGLSPYGSLN
jgi:hypothetical protein